ncbi:MAG: YaeQ family protein [Chitinophagaceae bacterium]|nr:YaeQ family protein [Oligoflexus sp.]
MAIKSTIFKANLSISDISRGYYEEQALTIARHPSETDLRMILRLVVFALNAHENLSFTKGLSDADEPDIWQKSLTGDIEHWIDLGQPAEKRIRQACGKSDRVSIYTYQKGSAMVWYEGIKDKLERFDHLNVTHLSVSDEHALTRMIDRSMQFTCVIEDQHVLLSNEQENITIELKSLKTALAKNAW